MKEDSVPSSCAVSVHPHEHAPSSASTSPDLPRRPEMIEYQDEEEEDDDVLSDFLQQQRAFYMRTHASATASERDKSTHLSSSSPPNGEGSKPRQDNEDVQPRNGFNSLGKDKKEEEKNDSSCVSSSFDQGDPFLMYSNGRSTRPPVARPFHLLEASSSSFPFRSSSTCLPQESSSALTDTPCDLSGQPSAFSTSSIFAPKEPFQRLLLSSSSLPCSKSSSHESSHPPQTSEEEEEEVEEEQAVLSSAAIREQLRLQLVAARYVQQGMVPPVEILAKIEALLPKKEKKKRLLSVHSKGGKRIEAFSLPLLSQLRRKIREGTRQEAFAQLEERQRLLNGLLDPEQRELYEHFCCMPESVRT
ncbi:swi2 snf2 brahma-like, partial [Cystoisospora suis]